MTCAVKSFISSRSVRLLRRSGRARSWSSSSERRSAGRRCIARRKRRSLAVDLDPLQVICRLVLDRHRAVQPRPQPAAEQLRLRGGAGHANPFDLRDAGPERRELPPPPARPRPRDVRHDDTVEDRRKPGVRRGQVRPFGAVDDQAVDDVDQALERGTVERRHPAPAQEHRQIGKEQGLHDACRRRGPVALQLDPDRLGADLTAFARGERLHGHVGLEPVCLVRLGDEHDRPRGVAFRETLQHVVRGLHPLRRHPGCVRHHARALIGNVRAGRACAARRPPARSRGPTLVAPPCPPVAFHQLVR